MSKKYILNVGTSWCGENNEFAIITDNADSPQLNNFCELTAYENFCEFEGSKGVLEDLFPDVVDEEYSDEQIDEASSEEHNYYSWNIELYNEEDHGSFDWYELIWED
jgi:hypothetical protein